MVEYMGIIFISHLSVFSHFQMINVQYLNNKITMKFAFLKGMDIVFIQTSVQIPASPLMSNVTMET